MLTRSALLFAFAAVPAILGFPSIFADMRQLAETLGMPPAEWHLWNYLMVGGGLFVMALGAYGMALGAHRRWAQGRTPQGKAHSVDAGAASHHWHVPQPTVTVKPASFWTRIRHRITRRKRLEHVSDLQRCLNELIKYSGFPVAGKITVQEIEASNALLVNLERACAILDEQSEAHPPIEKSLIVTNHTEWIQFLTKRLARADAR